jgi:hypothetical protein
MKISPAPAKSSAAEVRERRLACLAAVDINPSAPTDPVRPRDWRSPQRLGIPRRSLCDRYLWTLRRLDVEVALWRFSKILQREVTFAISTEVGAQPSLEGSGLGSSLGQAGLGLLPDVVVSLRTKDRRSGSIHGHILVAATFEGQRYLVSMLGERSNCGAGLARGEWRGLHPRGCHPSGRANRDPSGQARTNP